jgi:hypothetical protein
MGTRPLLGGHHLRIAAVALNPGEFLVAAVDEIAATAEFGSTAAPAEKADADALAMGPSFDAFPECVDDAYYLMPGHAWPLDRKDPLDGCRVRMADAARLDANADVTRGRCDQWFSTSSNRPGATAWIAR